MSKDQFNKTKRIGLFLPLLLIAIGLIYFWEALSGPKVDGWRIILIYWPILFILGGIEGLFQGRGTAIHVYLVTIGLGLLLSNLGRITWTSWELILSLWPVSLIALGLDLFFGKHNRWARISAGVLVLLIMGGLVLFFDSQLFTRSTSTIDIKQDKSGSSQAEIVLEPSIGFLKVFAQGSPTSIVDGEIRLWEGEGYTQEFQIQGDTGYYQLASSGFLFVYEPGIGNRAGWDIGVSSRMPVDLHAREFVGEMTFELSELHIDSITTKLAVGITQINLPYHVGFKGTINQEVGKVIITVPEDVGFRLIGDPVIGGVIYPDSYSYANDQLTSPGFEEQAIQITLDVDLTIGQIIIVQK